MSAIVVEACGVVSPAGWGLAAFRSAVSSGVPIPVRELIRPGSATPLSIRSVPATESRPACLGHSRLRRTSPISQYAAAAVVESLGKRPNFPGAERNLGLVLCVTCGCVNYSRRFYSEALKDPGTASPLIFPETVFNAPASHICSVLESGAASYTLVGDQGTFLQGLAFAANSILSGDLDGCVVVGADEMDWLIAYGVGLLDRNLTLSEGAGSVYLRRAEDSAGKVVLSQISSPQLYGARQSRLKAAQNVRKEIVESGTTRCVLSDGLQGSHRTDSVEAEVWKDWAGPRLSVRRILGEGLMSSAAWQTIAAIDTIQQGDENSAIVSIVGSDQAIAARFSRFCDV